MTDVNPAVRAETTSFTVRAMRNGSPVTITWTEGALHGDPPTVDLIDVEADLAVVGGADPIARRAGAGGGPVPVRGLQEPEFALALIRLVVDRVTDITDITEGP